MKDFKLIFLFLILMCFYSCAEFQNAYGGKSGYIKCRKEIFGTWKTFSYTNTFNIRRGHDIKTDESEIWVFNENDTVIINKKAMNYELEDCERLTINYDEQKIFFKVKQYNDTLYLSQGLSGHESINIGLKRIN
ncbi:hypothetical protein [uncultured Flavobacterium sp.]|uniref:hypothetical protein n=1 Tax=uncultured Flavobacterium sp. TaxID=165435 RepID=UPI003081C1E8